MVCSLYQNQTWGYNVLLSCRLNSQLSRSSLSARGLTRFLNTSFLVLLCSDSGIPRKMSVDLIDLFLRSSFSFFNVSNSCNILSVGWVSLRSSSVISSFRSSFSYFFSISLRFFSFELIIYFIRSSFMMSLFSACLAVTHNWVRFALGFCSSLFVASTVAFRVSMILCVSVGSSILFYLYLFWGLFYIFLLRNIPVVTLKLVYICRNFFPFSITRATCRPCWTSQE